MNIEMDGISFTPEFFSSIMQLAVNELEPPIKVRPEQISNIQIKDITEEEIIVNLNYKVLNLHNWLMEITIPKEKTLNPIEGACEYLRMRKFKLRYLKEVE